MIWSWHAKESAIKPLNRSLKASLELLTQEYEANLPLAEQYLQERGINPDTARRFRLGVVNDSSSSYHGRLSIPALGVEGKPYSIRFRALGTGEPKYLGMPGVEVRLFNVRAVHEADDTIHVTEGELDAVVLDSLGLPAVGVSGSNAWKRHHARMLAGFTRVYVWGDGDEAGQKFAGEIANSLVSVYRCKVGSGQDVTDIFLADGEAGIRKAMGEDE
jgi:DNA primase